MPKRSSNKKAAARKDGAEGVSSAPEKDKALASTEPAPLEAADDCIDDIQKGEAVVEKLIASAAPKPSTNCKCMQRGSRYYCYKLIQGRWTQSSATGYPSKEICEANNCMQ